MSPSKSPFILDLPIRSSIILQSYGKKAFYAKRTKENTMRIPISKHGYPQILAITLICGVLALVANFFYFKDSHWPWFIAWLIVFIGAAFFRDFERVIPQGDNLLVSPADGTVTDIGVVDESEFFEGKAMRIGIFLSVLSVHVNRVPCKGIVKFIKEKPGLCLNAMGSEKASQYNQSTSLGLECPAHPAIKVMIKQITGAIARRIVCASAEGIRYNAGDRYGMIKFGSRTELFLPVNDKATIKIKVGDKVTGGATILVEYI
jgi:phosphatidylserine decarboxylase